MTHYWITPWREWIGIIHMCHSFVLLYRRQAMLVFSDDLSSVFFLSGFFPSFYSCIIWFLRYFPKVDIRVGTFLWTVYIYTYEYAWWGSFVLNKHIIIHITSDITFFFVHFQWSIVNENIAIAKYDYVYAENGLVAYKDGKQFFEEVCFNNHHRKSS